MRLVLHGHNTPLQVEGKTYCRCGLSKNFPFCDASHHKTTDEQKDKIYTYDKNQTRVELPSWPTDASDAQK